jgi:hypothetical protein
MNEMGGLVALAQRLADRLREDIPLSRTRDEHIRVTARANEALELFNGLTDMLSNEEATS